MPRLRACVSAPRHATDTRPARRTLWYSETRMSESLRSVRRSAGDCPLGARVVCAESGSSLQRGTFLVQAVVPGARAPCGYRAVTGSRHGGVARAHRVTALCSASMAPGT